MKEDLKQILILAGLVLLVMSPLFALGIVGNIIFTNACEEIGFDSYIKLNEIEYCVDIEKNLYTVSLDCKWFNCKAKQIEIRSYKP